MCAAGFDISSLLFGIGLLNSLCDLPQADAVPSQTLGQHFDGDLFGSATDDKA